MVMTSPCPEGCGRMAAKGVHLLDCRQQCGGSALQLEDRWKITFLEQQADGLKVCEEPVTPLRAPEFTNLRMNPFERAEHETAVAAHT